MLKIKPSRSSLVVVLLLTAAAGCARREYTDDCPPEGADAPLALAALPRSPGEPFIGGIVEDAADGGALNGVQTAFGTIYNWGYAPVRPRLTLVNVGPRPRELPAEVEYVEGDATKLPFEAGAFDVVYSNSVIEHLSTNERQRAMAEEIKRVGPRYFVQTPSVYFPIEPHLLTPLIHWVPRRWRVRLIRNFTVWGWVTRPTPERCQEFVEEVRLLGNLEMRRLFPDARVITERVAGLSKSLLAVRT